MGKIIHLYLIGLLQGIAIVLYPSAGNLLTNLDYHDLSASDYGAIFLPQIIGAILASLIGGGLGAKLGLKTVYLAGLLFNGLAMLIFAGTNLILDYIIWDLAVLFLSTFFLGLGFGSTLTMLNTYMVEIFPNRSATAVTALHTLLGTGTAIAPLMFTFFMKISLWWLSPLIIAVAFFCMIVLGLIIFEHSTIGKQETGNFFNYQLPGIFYLFGAIVFIYGTCETIFGNWATIYLKQEKFLNAMQAGAALSLFWAMVTVGRAAAAGLSFLISPIRIFLFLPLVICFSFIAIAYSSTPFWNIFFYGLAGLGCSACFPLSISLSTRYFFKWASQIGGIMMALYMAGYGMGAYGVGLLHEYGQVDLGEIYMGSSVLALAMFVLIYFLVRNLSISDKQSCEE